MSFWCGRKRATVPALDGPPTSVSIEALDRTTPEITLKVGGAKAHLLADRLTLHPDWQLGTGAIVAALRDVIEDQCGPRRLSRDRRPAHSAAPRLTGGAGDDILESRADPVAGTIAAVARMEETVLPIQDPPGTGKTYVTARTILPLVRAGHRVGVASNSHEAIRSVLRSCVAALKDKSVPFTPAMAHKVSGEEDNYYVPCRPASRSTSSARSSTTPASPSEISRSRGTASASPCRRR